MPILCGSGSTAAAALQRRYCTYSLTASPTALLDQGYHAIQGLQNLHKSALLGSHPAQLMVWLAVYHDQKSL